MDFFTNLFNRPFVIPSLFLSIALIIGLWIVGAGIANRGAQDTISSTGSASQNIKADQAKWTVDVRHTAGEGAISYTYGIVSSDAKVIQKYFNNQQLASSTVTASVIYTDQDYKQDQNAPVTYTVHEQITVQTTDVDKIDALSRDIGTLNNQISQGSVITVQPPEYYVSTLPALRISLIGKAIADAKARASEIAKSGGSSIGKLQSASSGVVQVLAPNSTNVEDYGSYDTSTIQKQVMVTARATFSVN